MATKLKTPELQRVHLKDNCDYARQRISTIKTQLRRLEAFLMGCVEQAEQTNTSDKKRDASKMLSDVRRAVKDLEK